MSADDTMIKRYYHVGKFISTSTDNNNRVACKWYNAVSIMP